MYICTYNYALVSQPDIHVHVYFPQVSIHVHTNDVWLARLHVGKPEAALKSTGYEIALSLKSYEGSH